MRSDNADGSVLFLSCDLQNSTQFKHAAPIGSEQDWVPTFLAFYNEFPAALGEIIAESYPRLSGQLNLWKAVGDELIFTCWLESEEQCCAAVEAWLAAMTKFEQDVLVKTPMTLKGGAFLATVPYPDRQVAIPRTDVESGTQVDAQKLNEDILNGRVDPGRHLLDFVGPSIDTGFRVLRLAAHRYFVLTVDVAHIVFAHYSTARPGEVAHFLGTHRLRGVWESQPYPVFALGRDLGELPSQVLAAAIGGATLIDDEYPECSASRVVEALSAYRASPDWPGVVQLESPARPELFGPSDRVATQRQWLDLLEDDSEQAAELDAAGIGEIDIGRLPMN